MQIVTRNFRTLYFRFGSRTRDGKGRRGPQSAYLKNLGHRRHRNEVRRFLANGDWEGDVIAARPISGWDAF